MTAEPDASTGGRGTAALYTLLSVMFINMLGFGVIVPFLPFYAASFHAAPWQIGLVFSAYSIGSFVGEPFWGRLSDRVGRSDLRFCHSKPLRRVSRTTPARYRSKIG